MPSTRILPAGFDARPHRLSSLRAQARRSFRAAVARDDVLKNPAECAAREEHNHASPRRAAALAQRAGDNLTLLTARARALYEDSCVPIPEIARLAGVHERTLYKYARKRGWRRRNVRSVREKSGAIHEPGRKVATGINPPRGAGGRFIARENAGLAIPRGLKALDPAGGARAAAALDRAMILSKRALERARALREAGANARMLATITRMLPALAAIEDAIEAAASKPDDSADEKRRKFERRIAKQVRDDTARKLRALTKQNRRIDAIKRKRNAMLRGDNARAD